MGSIMFLVRVRVSKLTSDLPRFNFAHTSGDDELIYYLYFGRFNFVRKAWFKSYAYIYVFLLVLVLLKVLIISRTVEEIYPLMHLIGK